MKHATIALSLIALACQLSCTSAFDFYEGAPLAAASVLLWLCVVLEASDRVAHAVLVAAALGVQQDANEATIKKQYRKLSLQYHPGVRWF